MGNPRNRTVLDRRRFAANSASNRESAGATTSSDRPAEDTSFTVRKRVRFAQGTDCSLESESDAKAKLSDADAPKTSEYAFFKKLRQGVGRDAVPVHTEVNILDECRSDHGSGVSDMINQSFQNLKFSLRAQDERPTESSSPIAGPSKATDNSPDQLDFGNCEFAQPMKKAVHVNFEISRSPFRDRIRSAAANYVYGQGNIFSVKRDKLLQLVSTTYPESKDLNLNGVDLVNSMIGRLFPNGYDNKHVHRARKLRQQDTWTSWPIGFPQYSADCENFCQSGCHGSREAGDLMQLDYGCTSSGSTEVAKWSDAYSVSPYTSSDKEYIPSKIKKPYHISDYVRSRSPWNKYHPSGLSCETIASHTSSDIVSHHQDDLPPRQNLLLGWVDDKTEAEDQLQIAPYKFDYGISLYSDYQSLRKNDFQLEANCDSRLSRIQPQFVSGLYGNIDSYFQTTEVIDSHLASDNFLEDGENKSWDIIHSHSSGSYFTDNNYDSDLPFMNSHLLRGTPDISGTPDLIPTEYSRGQIMCIDQPWEVYGKEVSSTNYRSHNDHHYPDGGHQIEYPYEPSCYQTTYGIPPLTLDMGDTPSRSLYSSP